MKKLFGNKSGNTNTLIRRITSARFITSFAVILAVVAFGLWQYNNTTNQDRVFWGMIDNGLQTSSFSKTSTLKSGGQSAEQITDLFTSPKQEVYSRTHYVQTGADEADATTENIGTPYRDYVRYTEINTSQKDPQGQPYDFANIVNVWGASATQDTKETTGQLFNQSVLGVLPTGNLSAQQRKQVIKLMKDNKAYSYKMSKPSRQFPLARPSYTFTVTVSPPAYITALKEFARSIGLTQLESIDPAEYKDSAEMLFQVTVDGWSHQVTEVNQTSSNKLESISAHNVRKQVPAPPTKTIDIEELQSRLQSVE